MKKTLSIIALSFLSLNIFAQCGVGQGGGVQLLISNPSFELNGGQPQPHIAPPPWGACYGSPDEQPGNWGCLLPASNGLHYEGMLCNAGYNEGVTQQLSGCMVAGTTYILTFDLAAGDYPGYTNGCFASCEIKGGNSLCGNQQVLWQSGVINGNVWQTYSVSFTATGNWCYITISPYYIPGCNGYHTLLVDNIQPIIPAGVTVSGTDVTCFGMCDGTVLATPNAGTPPFTYQWSNGPTTAAQSNLCPGTYSVICTDVNNQGSCDTIIITEPPLLTCSISQTSTILCNGDTAGATATAVGGSPGYIFTWVYNGSPMPTQTGMTAGTYVCNIMDTHGCTATSSITITEPPAMTANSIIIDVSCYGANDGSITVSNITGGTAPYTYLWNPNVGNTATVNNLSAGNYTCIVTDANGCFVTQIVAVSEPTLLTIQTSQTNLLCNAVCIGQASVVVNGGLLPYSYLWSNGSTNPAISNVCAGVYSCTVTDIVGCTISSNFIITEPPVLAIQTTSVNSNCGLPDGTASVTNITGGTPGYTFIWQPSGQTTQTATNLVAGNHTVTVTDANNCAVNATIVVGFNPGVIASVQSSINATCFGSCDGQATIDNVGGTPPFTYTWIPNVGNTATLTNLCAGNYSILVTDVVGCTSTTTVNISEPSLLTVTPQIGTTICIGKSVTLTANGAGGTPPYIYNWTPLGPIVSPILTTVYTVTVTDANNCVSAPQNVTITVYPALSVIASKDDSVCPGFTATINAVATGGNGGPYAYSWTWAPNGSSNFQSINVTPTTTTTYYVTASDNCGTPLVVDSVLITVNPLTIVSMSTNIANGCEPLCVDFTDASTIATGTIVGWTWNFGDGTAVSSQRNPSHCYASPGVYSVTLGTISNLGCLSSAMTTAMITVYSNPVAEFGFTPTTTTVLNPVISFFNKSVGGASYIWDFGDKNDANNSTDINPRHAYSDTGLYCVKLTAISVEGCTNDITHCLVVGPEYTLFIPNAFTPNGDGTNDVFMPKGQFILSFDMTIFNRWGDLIFRSNDLNKGWDGTGNNDTDISQQDVYVYKIKVTYNNKDNVTSTQESEFIGHVTLIR